MIALAAGLLFVPLVDQGVKFLLRHRLGLRSVGLGPLGNVKIVTSQIWLLRSRRRPSLVVVWSTWLFAAILVIILSMLASANGFFAGLLLGGSLSHALESSLRGGVSDYICLRFWPAFNLADAAITVGSIGFVAGMVAAVRARGL